MTDETLSQANDIQRQIRDAQYRAYEVDEETDEYVEKTCSESTNK